MNKKRKKKQQGKNIMFASATQGGHKTFKNVSCGYVIKAVDEQGSLCGWVYMYSRVGDWPAPIATSIDHCCCDVSHAGLYVH